MKDLLRKESRTERTQKRMLRFFSFLFLFFLFVSPLSLEAEEDFGFGDSDFGFGDVSPSSFSIKIGGQVSAEFKAFYNEMDSAENFKNMKLGDIFSGKLSFDAGGSFAQGIIKFNLSPDFGGTSPISIDEAFARAFFGPVTIEAGLRKLSWGRADSFGPLDVINPLDYSDLTKISDPQSIKITRPMIHGILSLGSFTKLEAVFVPWSQGHKFATSGRWAPAQVNELRAAIEQTLNSAIDGISQYPDLLLQDTEKQEFYYLINSIGSSLENEIYSGNLYPDTNTLRYAQAGLRLTTSVSSSDFGFQYYFGSIQRPVITGLNPYAFFTPPPMAKPELTDIHGEALTPKISYNYYHQIGVDFARVIAGFNLRAEAGVNLTKDLDGTDGVVENPAIIWSLGFDRDVFAGINLNVQGTGRVRLFHNRLGDDPLTDCEAGTSMSSTRITGIVSRKFLREELELRTTALWGIEDGDFLIIPAVVWSRNDIKAEISAGFFGGNKNGELGQYRDNSFIKLMMAYSF